MISVHWGTETGEVESRTFHGVIRSQDAGKAFGHRIHVSFVPFQKMTRFVPHSIDFVGSHRRVGRKPAAFSDFSKPPFPRLFFCLGKAQPVARTVFPIVLTTELVKESFVRAGEWRPQDLEMWMKHAGARRQKIVPVYGEVLHVLVRFVT